jgi:HSP20 family molecular chaperone IbpA
LSFDDDFGDIFEDFDIFKLMRKSQGELEKILKRIRSGEIEGTWEIRQIDEPDMRGFEIRGRFGTEEPLHSLEPLEPLKPSRRRPLPERPFEIPKTALKEMREPLVDIFEENGATKVYVELPGVEMDDIKLNFGDGRVEVKAKNFYKTIDLGTGHLAMKSVSTQYKNGVLQITLPKRNGLRKKDAENLKAV